jgi:hypothetical protein
VHRYGRLLIATALAFAAGAPIWPRLWAEPGEHKHYLYQARAFLQGRLDIDEAFGDVATWNGHHYVVFPPFPALLITPLVAVFGMHTRTTLVSLALTGLNLLLLRKIILHLPQGAHLMRWALAAFFLGTAYTTALFQAYESWYFAHLVAVTCLLGAICESLARGRGLIVGLLCGLAFLSRHLCILASIYLAAALWCAHKNRSTAAKIVNLVLFVLALGACVCAYLILNYLRFGSPWNTGYQYLPLEGFLAERVARYGLFHPAYLPANLVHLFLQGFHVKFAPPALLAVEGMDPLGTSLTFASPFVFFALRARWQKPLLLAAWTSILLSIGIACCYYNNGFAQNNAQRFTLDFLPVLMLLVVIGAARGPVNWWKAAVGYSIALNALALFAVPLLQKLTFGL